MFAISGVLHWTTSAGQWVLPPSRAVWISAGVEHSVTVLAQVLIDQIRFLDQAPTELLMPADARAARVVDILRTDPGNRQSLAELASRAGASVRTLERVFAREAHMSFGAWRQRHRLLVAMEQLAYGASVTNVALEVGYESPSSFIAAFKAMFGATPARYFKSAGAE